MDAHRSRHRRLLLAGSEETQLHPIDERGDVDEIDGGIARHVRSICQICLSPATCRGGRDGPEIWMGTPRPLGARAANFADGSVSGKTEDVKEIVHVPSRLFRSAGSKRQQQLAAGDFVQAVEIHGAVALIAEQFEQGWTPFFLRRLQLAVGHPQELHLECFDEEIL
jgi:hypothetical protein